MIGIGDWIVKMFASRLRSLSAGQLKDLIHYSDERETLITLREHLESENFKYWHHLVMVKKDLIRMIDMRLDDIDWSEIEKQIVIVVDEMWR